MIRQMRKWEPLLLFLVIFFPGYVAQTSAAVDPSLFNSLEFNFFYLISAGPQLLLILYLILQDPRVPPLRYGLEAFRASTILKALGGTGIILLALLPVYLLNALLLSAGILPEFESLNWQFSNYRLLPLVFLTCLCTGYLEEAYFRAYLLTKGEEWGLGRTTLLITVNILFASGHLYQGILGFLVTFLIGLILSQFFFKKRNLHFIAWSHGYYNFLVLMLTAVTARAGTF